MSMNREILEKPFTPEQIKRRQGMNGDVLDYIEGCAVIQRLNECFDAEWIFEIQEHRVYDDEVVVLGKLTAQGVAKSQFGKSRITRAKKDNSIISLGDDLKAAATDCLKKCATLFGVGLHLYFDVPPTGANGNGQANGNGNGNGHAANGHTDANGGDRNGSPSGRLTAKQLSAIFALAKARGWSNKQVRDFSQEMFAKLPDFLNKTEASAVIQHLQGGHDD
jgi:Rad52/22 family double-strand break repair protein